MFSPKKIEDLYKSLSSLYKNPTRGLAELAAINVDDALIGQQQELQHLFLEDENTSKLKDFDPALYLKSLALLYEIEDYRGAEPEVRNLIVHEGDQFLAEIGKVARKVGTFLQPVKGQSQTTFGQRETFTSSYSRAYWKARVICCVATVESRRRDYHDGAKSLDELAQALERLEKFVRDYLHRQSKGLNAWTTLAFVHAAQARIARQGQEYRLAQHKLLKAIECLDGRAEEIRLQAREQVRSGNTRRIDELKDDLLSIRRKQTLISFFNVALVAIQRGFLRTANNACQSARLQFRLHGHNYHALFNELIILSIKRARTSRNDLDKFRELRLLLRKDIIRHVRPGIGPDGKGNRKLYLYALRELALLHSFLKQYKAMLKVLDLMEKRGPRLGDQWRSRVYHQRARAYWLLGAKSKDSDAFQQARIHSNTAFAAASGCHEQIEDYDHAHQLSKAIKQSKRTNLIETIESLITYGSIQISAGNTREAIKSAEAIIEYCDDDNPRLLAMGYLVRAEAHVENKQIIEAKEDVAKARILQRRIDHKYVADRMRAIEKSWLRQADYLPLEDLRDDPEIWSKATERLRGWVIENHTRKKSPKEIEVRLKGMNWKTVKKYLESVKKDPGDPFHDLGKILLNSENIREGKRKAKSKEGSPPEATDQSVDNMGEE